MNEEVEKLLSESKARQDIIRKKIKFPLKTGIIFSLANVVALTIAGFYTLPSFIYWAPILMSIPFLFWCFVLIIKDEQEKHLQGRLHSKPTD